MKTDTDNFIWLSFAILAALVLAILVAIGLAANVSANADGDVRFTATEQAMLKPWGVSEEDYRLFVSAREIAGGLVSVENLTVYELLGFMTGNPAKRREYARKQAKLDLLVLARLRNFEDLHRAEVARLAETGRGAP